MAYRRASGQLDVGWKNPTHATPLWRPSHSRLRSAGCFRAGTGRYPVSSNARLEQHTGCEGVSPHVFFSRRFSASAGSTRLSILRTSKSRSTDTSTPMCEFFITATCKASRTPRFGWESRRPQASNVSLNGYRQYVCHDASGGARGSGCIFHVDTARSDVNNLLQHLAARNAVECTSPDGGKHLPTRFSIGSVTTNCVEKNIGVKKHSCHGDLRVPSSQLPNRGERSQGDSGNTESPQLCVSG